MICCLSLAFSLPAQEVEKAKGIEIISQKLEKANQTLSKKLDKINKRLAKKLNKVYPQLRGVNLDSLLEERAYQKTRQSKLQTADSSQQYDAISATKPDTQLNDSTLRIIQQIKTKLTEEMGQTPAALNIHQELGESLDKLGKTEELLQQLQAPDLPELPNLDLPQLPQTPDLNDLLPQKYFEDLKSSMEGLSKLFDEYKGQFEGWDQKLLARATSLEEVKLLQQQKELMDSYQPLPEGYRQNMEGLQTNDFVEEKLKAKAEEIKRVGAKSLQERFDQAQAKMDKAKQKFNAIDRTQGGQPNENPYVGKTLLERLAFGGNFQVNRQRPGSIDAALQASYLTTARIRFGLGGTYRINLGKNGFNPDFDRQVFGTRSFFDYTLFRSAFVQASYEWSNTDVLTLDNIAQGRQWVQSGMLGLGNRFTLPKGMKGNFVALYNFLHDERSPNPNPWVIRFGFEF